MLLQPHYEFPGREFCLMVYLLLLDFLHCFFLSLFLFRYLVYWLWVPSHYVYLARWQLCLL